MSGSLLISEKEVARRLAIGVSTVRRLARNDPSFPAALKLTPGITGVVRYDAAAVEAWLKTRPNAAKKPEAAQ